MRAKQPLAILGLTLAVFALSAFATTLHAQIIRGPYAGYPPYGFFATPTADVRLQVAPSNTEVYVDGYYAGIADDFDGLFQRLHVLPGPHTIELYLPGYHSFRENVYLSVASNPKLRHTMMPLAAGEKPEARPVPATPPPDEPDARAPGRRGPFPEGPRGGGPGQGRGGDRPLPPPPSGAPPESRFGSLSIRVQPANAEVTVDGQRWPGPEEKESLMLQLSEGRHHVEVRKDGYEAFSADIEIKRGETAPLNVSLMRR